MPWSDTIKHIASTFVELPDEKQTLPTKATQSKPEIHTPQPQMVSIPASVPVQSPIVDDAILDKLRKKIEGVGAAFVAFSLLEKNLAPDIPNEQTRWRASLTALKVQGITTDDLYGSFDAISKALDREVSGFTTELQKRSSQEVVGRQDTVQSLREAIASKQSDIARIQQEIIGLQQQQAQTSSEIAVERGKLDAMETSFNNAVLTVRGELQQNRSKVETYLGGVK